LISETKIVIFKLTWKACMSLGETVIKEKDGPLLMLISPVFVVVAKLEDIDNMFKLFESSFRIENQFLI